MTLMTLLLGVGLAAVSVAAQPPLGRPSGTSVHAQPDKPIVVVGCIGDGVIPGTFALTRVTGPNGETILSDERFAEMPSEPTPLRVLQLIGSTTEFKKHLAHKVQASGVLRLAHPNGAAARDLRGGRGNPTNPPDPPRPSVESSLDKLQVQSIKVIAVLCPEGDPH